MKMCHPAHMTPSPPPPGGPACGRVLVIVRPPRPFALEERRGRVCVRVCGDPHASSRATRSSGYLARRQLAAGELQTERRVLTHSPAAGSAHARDRDIAGILPHPSVCWLCSLLVRLQLAATPLPACACQQPRCMLSHNEGVTLSHATRLRPFLLPTSLPRCFPIDPSAPTES